MVPLILVVAMAVRPTPIAVDAGAFGDCGGILVAETRDVEPPTILRESLDETDATVLPLAFDRNWRVTLQESRCWMAPLEVSGEHMSGECTVVRAWPRRRITGTLSVPEGASEPAALGITLQSPRGGDDRTALNSKVVEHCALHSGRFECAVPAAVLDVRLEASGFAPVYLWQRDVRERDADLGAVKLDPGASVAGWVKRAEGNLAPAEVELRPSAAAETAALAQHLDAQSFKVKTTDRGFFQVRGIPVGTYALSARAEAMSPARMSDVRIAQPREYLLDDVVLEPLARVEVIIDPPLTPRHIPWEVQLRLLSRLAPIQTTPKSSPADENGQWSKGGLEHGLYVLNVHDDAGSRVAERELDIRGATETVRIAIGDVSIRGELRIGSKSARGTLRFFSGGVNVTIETDAAGVFGGSLPKEGVWQVEATLADALQRVRKQRVKVQREAGEEVARVDIELAGGRIEGTVIDSSGKPVPAAQVIVRRGAALDTNGATDEAGRFTLIGLEKGAVAITATKDGVDSAEVTYTVADDATPLTLQLEDLITFAGRLINVDGSPVTGAVVRYFFSTRRHAPAVTGPSGRFSVQVPRGLATLSVVVIAVGLPVKVDEVPIPKDGRSLDIRVGGVGGTLIIHPGEASQVPVLQRGAIRTDLRSLFAPNDLGPPREMREDGFHLELEPGPYAVCVSQRCLYATVNPGDRTFADFRSGGSK